MQVRSRFYMDMKQKTLRKCYVQEKNILHLFCFMFWVFNLIIKKICVPMQWLCTHFFSSNKAQFAFEQNCISNKALVRLCMKFYFMQWLCTKWKLKMVIHKDMLCLFYDLRQTALVFRQKQNNTILYSTVLPLAATIGPAGRAGVFFY